MDETLASRHPRLHAHLLHEIEFPQAGARFVAVWVAEVSAGPADVPLDAPYALLDLGPRVGQRQLGHSIMAPGVRADGDERIGREQANLLPIHHEIGA